MEYSSTQNQPKQVISSPQEEIGKSLEELLTSTKEHGDTIIISATPEGHPIVRHTKNLYPVVRHTLLLIFILLCIAFIIFLILQNGKSIYDNGL